MSDASPVSFDDVRAAAARLDGVAHRTPVLTSRTLDALVGAEVFVKCENFQRIGAFKFRGAYNAIAQLPAEQRAKGVAAYSSGNHAQATALAARELGTTAVILMPEDAPRSSGRPPPGTVPRSSPTTATRRTAPPSARPSPPTAASPSSRPTTTRTSSRDRARPPWNSWRRPASWTRSSCPSAAVGSSRAAA